ncbi:hypothetical protein [Delftia lacustris]|nr:hypothetical protein [Delftia lacustris]
MTDIPPVPPALENGAGGLKPPAKADPGSISDPIERGLDPGSIAVDNAKLRDLNFAYSSRVHSFYFVLAAAASLFIGGAITFVCMSARMFGWQTILILFAFFTPATILMTVLIRAIFPAEKKSEEKKGEDKKDDLSDMLPSSAVVKLLSEVLKSAK